MIVDFFVAGVQKAGTTALHDLLSQHPDIAMSAPKETHVFDNEALDWSRPDFSALHRAFDRPARLRGEATPITMFWPEALNRLQRYNPQAKLIMSLRHPAFRAHSHWRMERTRGVETRSFAEATAAAAPSVIDSGALPDRRFSYLERGFYAGQIRRALALFPRQHLHFLRVDRLWASPSQEWGRIACFLGLSEAPMPESRYVVSVMTQPMGGLDPHDQARLTALFATDINDTARLTGLDLSDWLDPLHGEALPQGDQRGNQV